MENRDFDPEFSEYNPIFAELKNLKENQLKREDVNFISSFIKKLMTPVFIPEE
ncbi:MAG: hypothetical protein LUE64_07075 [Candidatus Gastranaerophilales bacterium]|nr:hypothetical protein [Candidatus Gastranaerophilales bacterium]